MTSCSGGKPQVRFHIWMVDLLTLKRVNGAGSDKQAWKGDAKTRLSNLLRFPMRYSGNDARSEVVGV